MSRHHCPRGGCPTARALACLALGQSSDRRRAVSNQVAVAIRQPSFLTQSGMNRLPPQPRRRITLRCSPCLPCRRRRPGYRWPSAASTEACACCCCCAAACCCCCSACCLARPLLPAPSRPPAVAPIAAPLPVSPATAPIAAPATAPRAAPFATWPKPGRWPAARARCSRPAV